MTWSALDYSTAYQWYVEVRHGTDVTSTQAAPWSFTTRGRPPPVDPVVVIAVGLILPFVMGLAGVRTVHRGFVDLARTLPTDGGVRRQSLLLAMVLCATFVYALVAPVALYRIGQALSHFL